ncbi:hypothetical protein VE00_10659 [Pseudogymnoascus sp. WSF 3629]|nr:hypothetical protein VE00_10659 [Pseudogymnoascus sp. WSF 3629]
MSLVDFAIGSTTLGGLRGGNGRRHDSRGSRHGHRGCGGKGYYTPKGNFVTSTTLAIKAKKTNTTNVQHVITKHPV